MKEKELYTSPETEVMVIKLESMIAASVDSTITDPFSGLVEDIW